MIAKHEYVNGSWPVSSKPQLARSARRMSLATLLALIAIPVAYLGLWVDLGAARKALGELLPGIATAGLANWQLGVGFVAGLVPLLILTAALLELRRFFGLYEGGDAFPADAGRRLRRFGAAIMILAVATMLVRWMASVLFTWHLGTGSRQLAISVSSSDGILLLFGGLALMIGNILTEARRVAEENRMFV
jgi:hypothetical protein